MGDDGKEPLDYAARGQQREPRFAMHRGGWVLLALAAAAAAAFSVQWIIRGY